MCPSLPSELQYHYETAHQLLEAKNYRWGLSQSFTAKANTNSPVATPESAQLPPHYPVAFLKPPRVKEAEMSAKGLLSGATEKKTHSPASKSPSS